jgi:murein DD-endopeptidase MepM/ murein hydrolase activator NlpD
LKGSDVVKRITDYPISTGWHEVDNFHPTPHEGIDLKTPLYTEIISQDEGVATLTVDKWLGNTVRLKLNDSEIVVYGHISEFKVKNGEHVSKNQVLALTGGDPNMKNQGHTTGPHVHVSLYNSQGTLISPYTYLFHHQGISQSNINPIIYPILLIALLIFTWRYRKYFKYSVAIILGLIILFIVS